MENDTSNFSKRKRIKSTRRHELENKSIIDTAINKTR